MGNIANNLTTLHQQITAAAKQYGTKATITLVAVSKTRSSNEIACLAAAGQLHFGENYLQEALPKIQALANYHLVWHYIGRIQTRKTKALAQHFSWVQSIDNLAIATALNKYRLLTNLPPLNVCIQVNINAETTKAGCAVTEILPLALAITKMPGLKLRGLMAIPAISSDFATQLATNQLLADAFNELKITLPLDTLSIGMSHDFIAAIAAGATMLRIGTAIFGPRLTL